MGPGIGNSNGRGAEKVRGEEAVGQPESQPQEAVEGVNGTGVDGKGGVEGEAEEAMGGDVVMVSPRPSHYGGGSEAGTEGDGDGEGAGSDVERGPNLNALMTMLVVSVRMQRLVHWVVRRRCLDGLSEENMIDLLEVLEVIGWFDYLEWIN